LGTMEALTIHEAAETTGWSARMLRYVARAGLVIASRSAAGYRLSRPPELQRLRTKIALHRHFKRLMSVWRSLHVVLAITLLGLIGTHVWVSVRVGFRWLWK